MASYDRLIQPNHIQSESDYNVKTLVLKQVDRATYLLSIERARTTGTSENHRALGFGTKAAIQSIEALISPYLKEGTEYKEKSQQIQKALTYLENTYQVNPRNYKYTNLLNLWLTLLVKELSKLGYFPSQPYEDFDENYD
jgi:hypothetical protein